MVMSPVHQVWPKPSCKAKWPEEEDKADTERGGKTTSGNGQAWSSPSPRGKWRTRKNTGNWLRNHLWCPNDPHGYWIDDDDPRLLLVMTQQANAPKPSLPTCFTVLPPDVQLRYFLCIIPGITVRLKYFLWSCQWWLVSIKISDDNTHACLARINLTKKIIKSENHQSQSMFDWLTRNDS